MSAATDPANRSDEAMAQRATVLVVDDEAANLEVLAHLLQPRYRVRAARSGEQALRMLASPPLPDLVLLDVMMPELDGHAVLARLQRDAATRDLPVIFVTALGADGDECHGLELGAVDYLTKPVRPAILLARVRTQLELKRARDLLADHNSRLEAEVARRTAEILALNAALEQRVAERTAQLAAANRELEAFAYTVSHDLKAPLRAIDGYSQMVQEDFGARLDEPGRDLLRKVRGGVARMHRLIEDLLAYSRMERRVMDPAPLDLRALVAEVVAEFEPELAACGALLRVDVPPCTLRADHDGLALVLRNLLGNALKFSRDAHPPAIDLSARSGEGVNLCVRDNGIGFDMQFHDRIFDIFTRLDPSGSHPGSGVGLALVRKAMQRLGGRVWAESAPGRGAAFHIEIPQ